MTLTWNLITKHLNPHAQLQAKIRQKIAKLETHLQHFPPDTVHLLVHVERHPKRKLFTVALTLRLPSNILHSRKQAVDPIPAFDQAVKALLRELSTFKASLRREQQWKPEERWAARAVTAPVHFAKEPHAEGPQSLAETLAEMIRRYHGRLLYHVQRQLWRAQLAGLVPKGAVTAQAVVDEVAQHALAKPHTKPEEVSYRFWLFALAQRELRRRYRHLRKQKQESVPLDEARPADDAVELAEGYDAENPLELIREELEPTETPLANTIPDDRAASPDAVVMEKDLIHYLHRVSETWPARERAIFELHFLEGFEADEIAMLEKLEPAQAQELIGQVQTRLRRVLLEATDFWVRSAHPTTTA